VRKTLSVIALLAAGSLALSGCGGSGSSSNGSTDGSSGGSGGDSGLALADINAHPRSDLKEGGTVRFAISQLPTNWNPLNVDGNMVDQNTMWFYTGPDNWVYAEDASFEPNTNFVESYDVKDAEGDNPQVVTLQLNPKAVWNSGDVIDWEDYKASWEACNGKQSDFNCASTDGWNQIAKIEKGDKVTDVVVTFNSSYPDWSSVLSSVYAKEGVSDAKTFNEGWAGNKNYHPEWHTGPFMMESINDAERVITMKRNDKWWGDKAMLDSVSFHELQSPANVQGYANNEIDVVDTMINANEYSQAKNRTDGAIRTAGTLQWRHFTFNSKAPNLTDVKVRQAIVRATNREAIAQSDLAGLPVEPAQLMLGNHFFMPGQEGYQDNAGDFSYDVEAAKKLLDEAGWMLPDGKTVREKDGKPLSVGYAMLAGVPTSENEGKLLQSDLAKVGVDLKLNNTPTDDFGKTLTGHDFGIIAFTWQGTNYPMANVRQIYGAVSEGSDVPSDSNFAQLINPTIEELIPQIDTETDKAKRVELTNEADTLIWEEVHTLPIYRRQGFTAVPGDLANYGAVTFKSITVEDIGYLK